MKKFGTAGIAIVVLVAAVLLLGCTIPKANNDNFLISGDDNTQLVGNDKDIHGCIGSTGYSWCEAKQKCIRVWEEDCNAQEEGAFGEGVGIANPASTNCVDHNGTLRIEDTTEGQIGICTLPGGKECEEWAYFRGECS